MKTIIRLVSIAVRCAWETPLALLGFGRLTDVKTSAMVRGGMVKYPDTVDVDICIGCGVCSRVCPMKCITMKPLPERILLREGQYKDKYPEIDSGQCMFCFQCHDNCPVFMVHHKAAAIHPRGIRKTGLKAQDLFKPASGGAKDA
jgi:energy-converting hydrogenase B subunit L